MRPVERRAILMAIAEELSTEVLDWVVGMADDEDITPADMADELDRLLTRQGVDLVELRGVG